jgi:hypothetical protein
MHYIIEGLPGALLATFAYWQGRRSRDKEVHGLKLVAKFNESLAVINAEITSRIIAEINKPHRKETE